MLGQVSVDAYVPTECGCCAIDITDVSTPGPSCRYPAFQGEVTARLESDIPITDGGRQAPAVCLLRASDWLFLIRF